MNGGQSTTRSISRFGVRAGRPRRSSRLVGCRVKKGSRFVSLVRLFGCEKVLIWVQVRTLYGPVPMNVAEHWPVLTSYDGLLAYAKSKGGRLPTEPELRLFLDTYNVGHTGGVNVGFRNWHPVPYIFVFGLNSYPSRSWGALVLSMLIHLLLSLQPCCDSFRVTPCAAHCAIHLSPIPITPECFSIVSAVQIVLDIV